MEKNCIDIKCIYFNHSVMTHKGIHDKLVGNINLGKRMTAMLKYINILLKAVQ